MALKNTRKSLLKSIQPGRGAIMGGLLYLVIMMSLGEYIHNEIALDFLPAIPALIIVIFLEKINARKRKYISLIEKQRILSIDSISSACSMPYAKVYSDISKMIDKGFFGDAYIDEANQRIVIPNNNIDLNTQVLEKSIECPTCGATVTVYSHKENKCEYCGTALKF